MTNPLTHFLEFQRSLDHGQTWEIKNLHILATSETWPPNAA
jgi:hypothetical protein